MRILLFLALTSSLLIAQIRPGAAFQPARLPNGKPDFNGIWQANSSAHYDIERHMARASLQVRQGPHGPLPAVPMLRIGAVGSVPGGMGIIASPSGKIPYKPEAAAKRDENRANWLDRDPEVKCYLPGIPRATYMPFPFQITQNASSFFITYEYAGANREIYFKDPGPPETDTWMGQSVGKWEGDTLVVVNTGFNDQTWFDRSGTHHGTQLKVTERFTLTSPYHIRYEASIEDPEVFTEPWKISLPLYRRMEPDARIMDFKCVEFVEELVFGEYRRKPLPRKE